MLDTPTVLPTKSAGPGELGAVLQLYARLRGIVDVPAGYRRQRQPGIDRLQETRDRRRGDVHGLRDNARHQHGAVADDKLDIEIVRFEYAFRLGDIGNGGADGRG